MLLTRNFIKVKQKKKKKTYIIVKNRNKNLEKSKQTSLSENPQIAQLLHSIHCQPYLPVDVSILSVNLRQLGWPASIP